MDKSGAVAGLRSFSPVDRLRGRLSIDKSFKAAFEKALLDAACAHGIPLSEGTASVLLPASLDELKQP